MKMKISLAQQIEEVERELKLRATVYPRMVASGKLKQKYADFHVERLQAVLDTLKWLNENRTRILDEVRKEADAA